MWQEYDTINVRTGLAVDQCIALRSTCETCDESRHRNPVHEYQPIEVNAVLARRPYMFALCRRVFRFWKSERSAQQVALACWPTRCSLARCMHRQPSAALRLTHARPMPRVRVLLARVVATRESRRGPDAHRAVRIPRQRPES